MNTDYLSYRASKVFYTDDFDGMFTREQLAEKRRKAEQCEKCPYPDDCHNPCPYDLMEDEELMDKFLLLHKEGKTDSAIAQTMRKKRITIIALRTLLGLKENKAPILFTYVPDKCPCDNCRSKAICKAFNGTCNEKVRWESK